MFKSLDEVIARWYARYQIRPHQFNHMATPGYLGEHINRIEKHLDVQFHSSFREVLLKVNLDYVMFRYISFGLGNRSFLQFIQEYHEEFDESQPQDRFVNHELLNQLRKQGLFDLGGGGYTRLLLDNDTGKIYATSLYDVLFKEKEFVAENLTRFICIAATITDYDWKVSSEEVTSAEVEEIGLKFLDAQNIQHGRGLWRAMIRDMI